MYTECKVDYKYRIQGDLFWHHTSGQLTPELRSLVVDFYVGKETPREYQLKIPQK